MAQLAEALSFSDESLAALSRRGDVAAFEAVMRRNNRRLFRLARSILGNDAEAEEAVQETYLRAYLALGDFAGQASLATWLSRIAINEALGRLRCRRQIAVAEPVEEGGAPLFHMPPRDPEQQACDGEMARILEQAIDRLPEAYRTVFVLRAVEQLSTGETAQSLGIPVETVKTRLHRARLALRKSLARQVSASLPDLYGFAGMRCDRIVAAVLRRLSPLS